MEYIDKVKIKASKELRDELGVNRTPNVVDIIEYLEGKSEFKLQGKAGTECYVNKEALRLAAVYLRDAYED